jgi:3-hydroxybutyryl-CoA dehydrogenase
MVKHVSILGAGTMGNGIAHIFAQRGFTVSLIDLSEKKLKEALTTISANLDRQVKKQIINPEEKNGILSRITVFTSLQQGVVSAELVIEAATESEKLKLDLFRELDEVTPPGTILASNTSSISITRIAGATKRPEMVIGMHFMNPVPVMKLVEVIKGYATSDKVTQTVLQLARKLEKIPVEVNDYPGFIANRLLMPMINEAVQALYEGVAGVEEIDTVMKLGMSHPMGPLELADFIGTDVCLYILRVLFSGFGNPKYAPCSLLVNMVEAGNLGIKSGQGFYTYNTENKNKEVTSRFRK